MVDAWTEYNLSERPRRDFIRVHLENKAMNDELWAEYEKNNLEAIFKQDDEAAIDDAKAEAKHDVELKAKEEAKKRWHTQHSQLATTQPHRTTRTLFENA